MSEKLDTTQVGNPIDDLLPRWTEFWRLDSEKAVAEAVKMFFSSAKATPKDFEKAFGINLLEYKNYFLEVSTSDSPEGPCIPGRVQPILVIRQTRTGKGFSAHALKHAGLYNEPQTTAWVEAEDWNAYVDDEFVDKLKVKADKERERMALENKKRLKKAKNANK